MLMTMLGEVHISNEDVTSNMNSQETTGFILTIVLEYYNTIKPNWFVSIGRLYFFALLKNEEGKLCCIM